jgi:putative heme-binding domain-containing protein
LLRPCLQTFIALALLATACLAPPPAHAQPAQPAAQQPPSPTFQLEEFPGTNPLYEPAQQPPPTAPAQPQYPLKMAEVTQARFELLDGDRVAFIGDTLLEREGRYGYLELALTARYPDRHVSFRNLGWSADTPLGESRAGFDPPEKGFDRLKEQLAAFKPTVAILGYGMASSFAGDTGLSRFVEDLKRLMDTIETLSAPNHVRFVILSPVRHEDLPEPLPRPARHNEALAQYSRALKELAEQRPAFFVDLFRSFDAGQRRQAASRRPFTDNGIHLTDYGYWRAAEIIVRQFGWPSSQWWLGITRQGGVRPGSYGAEVTGITKTPSLVRFAKLDEQLPRPSLWGPTNNLVAGGGCRLQFVDLLPVDHALRVDGQVVYTESATNWFRGVWIERGPEFDQAEELRRAIVKKNELFFHRWRPQNHTYLFGFRTHEQGQNAKEIPMFDPLIEAQEKKIAQLRKPKRRVYELVPMTGVHANLKVPDKWLFPSTYASKTTAPPKSLEPQPTPSLEVAEGFEVSLWAENPLLAKPIQMNFDPQGRLWVASSEVYPQIQPGQEANDKILLLEDADGDGKAEKSSVFADGLLIPTGVEPGDGGVYVGQSTELLHLRDVDGDGKADQTRVVLAGFGTEDTHHLLHTLRWGHDGQLYMNQSIYIHTHTETPHGVLRHGSGGVLRLRPPTMEFGVFLKGFCNPWGHDFDEFGQSFATDGAGFQGVSWGIEGATYFTYANLRRELPSVSPGNYPKFCGAEILYSQHFPDDWQGDVITCDFRAHRVARFALSEQGAGYVTKEMPDLLRSTNVTFRPIDVKLGPDGALYIADWSNPIIQHGEVDFRDPRRDHERGRIWRVTAKGRPLAQKPKLVGASNSALFAQLLSPNAYNRRQARRVLTERATNLVADLAAWTKSLSDEKQLLQALWIYQSIDQAEPELLKRLLEAKDGRLRAAATRVLRYWHNRVEEPLELLAQRVADEHPRVRVEALRALAQIPEARAAELALSVLEKPLDPFLDYAVWLTINDLADPWIEAVKSGEWKPAGREPQMEFALRALEPVKSSGLLDQLLDRGTIKAESSGPWIELIGRAGSSVQLKRLFEPALRGTFDEAATVRVLTALNDAARSRDTKPEGDLATLEALFQHPGERVRAEAWRLAGAWKLSRFVPQLLAVAGKADSPPAENRAAFDSLREIGGNEVVAGLQRLTAKGHPPATRLHAALTLAFVDLSKAVAPVLEALAETSDQETAASAWRGLLNIKGAGQTLARALPKAGLPPVVVKAGLRAARESGRHEAELIAALALGEDTKQATDTLSPDELKQLLAAVAREGDAARGERVFRRRDLACVNCHAIGGVGGKVGPDLTSIGASAPGDYLIESLYLPNAKIKEGYHAVVVETKDGEELSGVLVRENNREIVVRDATNREVAVPKSKVANRTTGRSLMPSGLLDPLSTPERVDLIRFLSELGKPGPYDASKGNVARLWRLRAIPHTAEQFGPENILASDQNGEAWLPAYTLVDGRLLKDDIDLGHGISKYEGVVGVYASTRFSVPKAGPVRLALEAGRGAPAWINGKSVAATSDLSLDLPAGEHTLLLKLDPRDLPPHLRAASRDGTFLAN